MHLKQLFYDEKIWVLEKGEMGEKLESYIIPINKRLYVMEDIDATEQCVLFKRNMKELQKKRVLTGGREHRGDRGKIGKFQSTARCYFNEPVSWV